MDTPHQLTALNQREREVLLRLAEGKTFKQIGLDLHLSPSTIKVYANRLRAKFNVQTARELAPFARDYEDA